MPTPLDAPRRRTLLTASLFLAGCVPPPELRLVERPELTPRQAVRSAPGYDGVPNAIRASAVAALENAGFEVLTSEARRAEEYLLVLRATCDRDLLFRWRCTALTVRLVDRSSSEIHLAASLNPVAPTAARMADIRPAIADSLRAAFARQHR